MIYLLVLLLPISLYGESIFLPDPGSERVDQPCYEEEYPDFLQLPAAPAVEHAIVEDPTGIGERWDLLIQTALRPNPKDFSWYREYGTWTCRYQQKGLVKWYSFPPSANASGVVGGILENRLFVASIVSLMEQGLQPEDLDPFTEKQLLSLETAPHPLAPQIVGDTQ